MRQEKVWFVISGILTVLAVALVAPAHAGVCRSWDPWRVQFRAGRIAIGESETRPIATWDGTTAKRGGGGNPTTVCQGY
jgi:hypothetical protein